MDNAHGTTVCTEATKNNPGSHCTVSIANRYVHVAPNFDPKGFRVRKLYCADFGRDNLVRDCFFSALAIKTSNHISLENAI